MISDIWTIVWKEWKELVFVRGNLRGGLTGIVVFVGVFGIFLPLQTGRSWVESPVGLFYWGWVPFFMVTGVIADSFAGERERHTLETLLASRLSDLSILLGKIAAAIGYGWGITLISLTLGLVTVNIIFSEGELLMFPPIVGMGIIGLSFLTASLAAGAGVLISLRASSVRQTQQTLGIAMMLVVFVPIFGSQFLPSEWKIQFMRSVMAAEMSFILLATMGALLVLDIGLFGAAVIRFRRAKLILD